MKYSFLFSVVLVASFLLDACHSTKQVAKQPDPRYTQTSNETTSTSEEHPKKAITPKTSEKKRGDTIDDTKAKKAAIAEEYAAKLGVSKRDITNYQLYGFIDDWYGTPYKYAGRSHSGVDCSDFVSLLFKSVYNMAISGDVVSIYRQCKPIKASELREGDLVFFKINRKSLSHIGVYLQNHKFVHASVHSGVVIDDLGESYYKRYFRVAGRILK